MTREEAIKNLQLVKDALFDQSDVVKALEMAIKALDQEPCEDAISRQEAIVALDDRMSNLDNVDMQIAMGFAKGIIYDLPPVTPQAKTGRWIAYEVGLPDRTILNYRCSVCGRKLIGYNTETLSEVPFCHCGAKMQEESE